MKNVLSNIEAIRNARGIKQEVMGEALGVSQAAYSNYVNRNHDITLSRLTQIANILQVSVVDIITYPEKYVPESSLPGHCAECEVKDTIIKNLNDYIKLLKKK